MGLSLKDALEKVGLKATRTPKTNPKQNPKAVNTKKLENRKETFEKDKDKEEKKKGFFSSRFSSKPSSSSSRPDFKQRSQEWIEKAKTDKMSQVDEPESAEFKPEEGKEAPIIRTTCGACRNPAPDVEFYLHSRKNLHAQWLCSICADKFQIADESRQTDSSDLSRRRMFRREFGRTKRYGFARTMQELKKRIEAFEKGENDLDDSQSSHSNNIDERTQNRHRNHVQQQEKLVHEGLLSHHLRDYKAKDHREQRDYNRRDRGDRENPRFRNSDRPDRRERFHRQAETSEKPATTTTKPEGAHSDNDGGEKSGNENA